MISRSEIKPYKDLAQTIVFNAATDYVDALKKNDERMIYDCERFFKSEWFMTLSDLDGEALMQKLRKEAGGHQRKWSRFRR